MLRVTHDASELSKPVRAAYILGGSGHFAIDPKWVLQVWIYIESPPKCSRVLTVFPDVASVFKLYLKLIDK